MALTALRRLSRGATVALAIMLVTGVLLDAVARGALHTSWWFRLSLFLLVAVGALNGRILRTLRKTDVAHLDDRVLRAVGRAAWAGCACIAAAAVLMEVKPF